MQDESVDEDVDMDESEDEEGWKEEYLQWWFDFLNERGSKGVTKDTWIMVCTFSHHRLMFIIRRLHVTSTYSWHSIIKFYDFIRSIDAKFSKYNVNGAQSFSILTHLS